MHERDDSQGGDRVEKARDNIQSDNDDGDDADADDEMMVTMTMTGDNEKRRGKN